MKNKEQIKNENIIEDLKDEIFRLKSVIENLPGSIYWKDVNGVYKGRNKYSADKMISHNLETETSKNEIIGKTDYDFFSKDIADEYRKHDLKVMETGEEISIEEPIKLPNGKILYQLSTKKPLYDKDGYIFGIVGNTVDITNLKETEAKLKEAIKKSEEANQAKTEFIRNMEHDIRTPFSGVWGLANYLLETEDDNDKKELLNDITQCAKELLNYCNSILDFSKIESKNLQITNTKFSIEKIINNVISIETPIVKHKELILESTLDDDIPSVVIGDQYRLYRILLNLVSNAIKFTHQGYVKIMISLIAMNQSTAVIRFTIKDSGIGIPKEKQNYIFEKFTRLTLSNTGDHKGIGSGLRIVRLFMKDIEGEIDLLSEPQKGTEFICTIPFKIPLTEDFVEYYEIKDEL